MFTAFTESSLNIQHPEGWEIRWFRGSGWCQARAHNDFMEKALEWGADMICILGSDQVHPTDILVRLLARHEEGCTIITALVPIREDFEGHKAGARLAWLRKGTDNELIDPEAGDIQQVHFIGTGVLMFPAKLLERVRKPWLAYEIVGDEYRRIANADSKFFWRLQTEGGVSAWVDTTIKVKHAHVFQQE